MEILPSEYQQIDLSRNEKIFVRNIMSNDLYGFLLLDTNPAMLPNECMHILVCPDGVLIFKFFDGFEAVDQYGMIVPMMVSGIYRQTSNVIESKLLSNKALIDHMGKLKFPVNILYVFPVVLRSEVESIGDDALRKIDQWLRSVDGTSSRLRAYQRHMQKMDLGKNR